MIGRRGVLGGAMSWWASGNARREEGPQAREAARPDHRVLGTSRAGVGPAPSQNFIRARTVVIFGTGAGTGLYEYNGTPSQGNPPVAYAAPPGVTRDPFNNILPSSFGGFTVVGNVGGIVVASLNGNSLAFENTTSPPASQALVSGFGSTSGTELLLASGKGTVGAQGVIATLLDSLQSAQATAQLVLNPGIVAAAPTTTALLEVQGQIQTTGLANIIAAGGLQAVLGDITTSSGNVLITTAGKGVVRTGETWHVVGAGGQPPFVNSFSAGGTAPRFQVEAIGAGRVRLSGAVNTGAVTGANTTIFTLPAGYVPTRAFSFATPNNVTAYTLGGSSIGVTTGGAVQLVPAGTAGKFVLLDGICFELD